MGRKKKTDTVSEEVASLKAKLNNTPTDSKKKKGRKTLSQAEVVEKKKLHVKKVVQKQEERLSQHIERVKNKEAKGQPANKERFYVTNAKLLEELYKWRDSAPAPKDGEKDRRVITEEFGRMIMMIADRLTNHSNFKNYPFCARLGAELIRQEKSTRRTSVSLSFSTILSTKIHSRISRLLAIMHSFLRFQSTTRRKTSQETLQEELLNSLRRPRTSIVRRF